MARPPWMPQVAMRLGMRVEDYQAHYEAGERWCTGCKAWHDEGAFGSDRSRPDGRNKRCREFMRTVDKARARRAKEARERPPKQLRATDVLRHVLGMVRAGRSLAEIEERILEGGCLR